MNAPALLLAWLVVPSLLLGCARARVEPTHAEHPVDPTPSAQAPVSPGTLQAPASSRPRAPPSEAPQARGLLPPLETDCAADADCELGWTHEIDGKCCDGTCSPAAATRAWVSKVAAICRGAGYSERCPDKKCHTPPAVVCRAKRCVLIEAP